MHCPRCTFPIAPRKIIGLVHAGQEGVEVDHCTRCGGTFFEAGEAPRLFGEGAHFEQWRDLWATSKAEPTQLLCPKDAHPLQAHVVDMSGKMPNEWSLEPTKVVVDVCEHCHGLWLDPGEGKLLHSLVKAAQAHEEKASSGHGIPGYLFQLLVSVPLEVWNPVKRRPDVVRALVAVLVACFLLELLVKKSLMQAPGLWMLVPTEVLSGSHLWTLLSHGFLHGGWAHLLGNLYFLWVFGDNVEDRLGKRDFLILYAATLVAGGLAHMLTHAQSATPLLGASGAISGVMGAYVVLFPRVRLWVMFVLVRARVRVVWYFWLWLAFQLVLHFTSTRNVAYMAHVGGFAVGALTAWLLQSRWAVQALPAALPVQPSAAGPSPLLNVDASEK